MRFWMIISLLMLGSSVTVNAFDADSLFARANVLFDEHKFAEAAALYGTIEEAGFRSAELDLNQGIAMHRLGRRGEAAFYFARAFRLDPANRQLLQYRQIISDELQLPEVSPTSVAHGATSPWIAWMFGVFLSIVGFLSSMILRRNVPRRVSGSILAAGFVLLISSIAWSALPDRHREGVVVRGPATAYVDYDALEPVNRTLAEGESVRILEIRGARTYVRTRTNHTGWIDRHRVREF